MSDEHRSRARGDSRGPTVAVAGNAASPPPRGVLALLLGAQMTALIGLVVEAGDIAAGGMAGAMAVGAFMAWRSWEESRERSARDDDAMAERADGAVGYGTGGVVDSGVGRTNGERRQGLRRDATGLMTLLDRAPVGLLSTDAEGRVRFVNATLAEWLERPAAELVSGDVGLNDLFVDWANATGDSGTDGVSHVVEPGGGVRWRASVTLATPDGRGRRVACELEEVSGPDGGVSHRRAVLRDLSDETAWRVALRQANDRMRRLFEDAPVGIALLDARGRFVECNRTLAGLTGHEGFAGLVGSPLIDLIEPRERATVLRELTASPVSATDGGGRPLEVRLVGEPPRVVQLHLRRLGDGAADTAGDFLIHAIDLTERRSLEAQFVQSQKMQAVGQLAGGVAHDFNNLLTAMIGFCDLLLLRHKPGDHSFGDVMQIKQNANRAANLVRQLLAFSRQQTLQARVLDVSEVLAELGNLLRRLIGETIELRLEHGRDLGLVKVDQNQLEQVIVNLVVNARDAMPGGGRLTITTANMSFASATPTANQQEEITPGDYVAIEVSDTGVGIPRDNIARIFEPFFSTKEVGAGTGLGLSTVYGIVRQTGGFVTVDSTLGEGARFTVLLPRHAGVTAPPEPNAARPGMSADLTGSATVLLVEDEDAVRVFSARALRNKGYEVIEAKNGEAALGLLGEAGDAVELLITDVVMPQMDGPTLARKARALLPRLRVIFISGYAEDRVRDDLEAVEGSHFLPKPFSLKQLAAKVKDVLNGG